MSSSMRHSTSFGGRLRPPPKYMSYSILSWRISRSSCASSSSIVAIEPAPRILILGALLAGVNGEGGGTERIGHLAEADGAVPSSRVDDCGGLLRCGEMTR